ncbi:MAG: acetyltransferase [Dermabacter sp.]|nr:acetyltransferase [Dermabacter sp.]
MSDNARAGWAPIIEVGRRLTVRYALNPHTHAGHEKVADALGYVRALDADTVTIETRRGFARVPRAIIVIVKEVPPPPVRRGRSEGPPAGEGA